ncbi:MAG: hypothetical protein WCW68_03085 [Methanothrix sp.]
MPLRLRAPARARVWAAASCGCGEAVARLRRPGSELVRPVEQSDDDVAVGIELYQLNSN